MTSVAALERLGTSSALARCVGDPGTFLDTVWGRRAVVHPGVEPSGFQDLLSFDDVDRILSTTSLRTPSFRLVQAGKQIPETAYTRAGTTGSRPVTGMADPSRIAELFRGGATIVLQGLHRYSEPVSRFVRDLELELGHACQVNAYVTPRGAQGLPLHDDPHDVFVLQAFGRKSWEVHAAPAEAERDPITATVASGDAIYMPTGTPHAAATQETISGHLTVGVHVSSWRDVLARAWKRVERVPALAQPLPAGWSQDPEGFSRALAERLDRARAELANVGAAELAEEHAIAFLSTRAPLLRGVLVDQQELEGIDDRSALERRPGSVCEIRTRNERLLVLLGDRRLEMPLWLEPAMRRIAAQPSFVVADLSDVLPHPPSRLVLVRRLVREGLLRPVR
ncbi:MAG TPA: cupin domain-containing protein [Actinomycetota bacterium]|nr:cupin domain-containing protein [Actinomycetota bacterium]